MKNKGFTLVELMVVIAILAILATIGVAVFNTVQRNARDGRSKADINIIARSLETARTIDAVAGTVKYTYSATTFANDFKTVPAGKYPYCIRSSDTLADVSSSPSAYTTACPTDYTDITTGGWPADNSYWKLCAGLEAGTVYCVQSISQ